MTPAPPAPRCPPDCPGMEIGDGNHSGCRCIGNGCDCPNHPAPPPARMSEDTLRAFALHAGRMPYTDDRRVVEELLAEARRARAVEGFAEIVMRDKDAWKARADKAEARVRVLEEQAPMDAYERLDKAEAEANENADGWAGCIRDYNALREKP